MASSPSSTEIEARPKTATQKYSAGPKASVISESGARVIRAMALTMPPSADDMLAMRRAAPDFPCWDIGNPSKVVTIADGVPGIRSSTAGMAPPYIEPL